MPELPKRYRCPFVANDVVFGGMLDEVWELAPWTDLFVDIQGASFSAPRFETRAKMLWTPKHFVIGAWLQEPQIWATLTEHNSVIFHDNDFEVFIDPDGDALRYFEFEVNAFGTTWDLYLEKPYRDGGSADSTWESGALVNVTIDGSINDPSVEDRGWFVEIAFPWECFGESMRPNPGDIWRVNFSRVQWQIDVVDNRIVKREGVPEDNWVWTPQGVIDMHQPEQWGFVVFESE